MDRLQRPDPLVLARTTLRNAFSLPDYAHQVPGIGMSAVTEQRFVSPSGMQRHFFENQNHSVSYIHTYIWGPGSYVYTLRHPAEI